MMYRLIIIAIAVILNTSCKKDQSVVPYTGHEYFPVFNGQTLVYEVDSIIWDDFYTPPKVDTFHYSLKEFVESSYFAKDNQEIFRIVRSIRKNDSLNFQIIDIWSKYRNNINAVRNEENRYFVKLVFPAQKGKKWNVNAMNELDEQEAKIIDVHQPVNLNGFTFDSVLTVSVQNDSNLIEKKIEKEMYAWKIGLIYREKTDLQTFIDGKPKSGNKVIYKIIHWQ